MYELREQGKILLLRAGSRHFVDCGANSYAYAVKNGELILREVRCFTPYGLDRIFTFENETIQERTAPFSGCVYSEFKF